MYQGTLARHELQPSLWQTLPLCLLSWVIGSVAAFTLGMLALWWYHGELAFDFLQTPYWQTFLLFTFANAGGGIMWDLARKWQSRR